MKCFCQFLRKILGKKLKLQTFPKLYMIPEIIDVFECYSTNFKSKFT